MKKFLIGTVVLVLVAGIGYFFVYPYDYIVRFEAPSFPGTVNQSVKIWHQTAGTLDSEVEKGSILDFEQEVQAGDSIHQYSWHLEPLTDSTTQVRVGIRDVEHSLANRWDVLTGGSTVGKISRRMLTDYLDGLNEHVDQFKVNIEGIGELPSTFYAYVELESDQHGKAGGMMDHYQFMSNIMLSNKVQLNGPPMVIVDNWDRQTDSLKFKFAFPIVRSDNLPEHPLIQYKRIFPDRALKATYNGNYITSDRAWYALLTYAEEQGFEVEETPVEIFYNNPTLGGDATRWKAEIFLPIKEEEQGATE
ncbi:effector-binding domain-containing protein [Robiginitalea myxolifaciens]|uniref:Effector-binding domain-containing protein n=1 Tax=Robiginitalea myxolifaciens TaxID=400055 RepID=A0A1I6G9G1_9FLAO|nr:GyrI-like domain-containing protein [Robiginitalea myxolifaciens]SFR38824.1 effector-binding domain-containing protein [Robiginitalea myxolifaciens]